MYRSISDIAEIGKKVTLVLTNGFEERVSRAPELISKSKFKCSRVVLVLYKGKEHDASTARVKSFALRLVSNDKDLHEVGASDLSSIESLLGGLNYETEAVVFDITGLARALLLRFLTTCYLKKLDIWAIYTEAAQYYPTLELFSPFLKIEDPSAAFEKLALYEETDVVYSSNCRVEPIDNMPGNLSPNYPLAIIGFLTFKRSRLSCVLNEFESNKRILIKSVPDRHDLRWREEALEIINFDLIDENRDAVFELPTLNWLQTYDFLQTQYERSNLQYRYNVILAPLGGKMQTLGAWLFAARNPEVKVITSTPKRLFSDKYSEGYTKSHLLRLGV